MRREYAVAIILAVSSAPFVVAMAVAPEYLLLSDAAKVWCFWGGITGFLFLIAAAVFVAAREDRRGANLKMGPLIMMYGGVAIVIVGFIWYVLAGRPDPFAPGPPPPDRPYTETASRLEVLGFRFNPPTPTTPHFSLKFHVKNNGKIAAGEPRTTWFITMANRKMTNSELDSSFVEEITDKAVPPEYRIETSIEPGTDGNVPTGATNLTQAAFDDLSTGKSVFYLFAMLIWADKALPKNWWWISEFCAYKTDSDFSYFSLCEKHNKIYGRYIAKH